MSDGDKGRVNRRALGGPVGAPTAGRSEIGGPLGARERESSRGSSRCEWYWDALGCSSREGRKELTFVLKPKRKKKRKRDKGMAPVVAPQTLGAPAAAIEMGPLRGPLLIRFYCSAT